MKIEKTYKKYKYILGTKETLGENTQKFKKQEAVL